MWKLWVVKRRKAGKVEKIKKKKRKWKKKEEKSQWKWFVKNESKDGILNKRETTSERK